MVLADRMSNNHMPRYQTALCPPPPVYTLLQCTVGEGVVHQSPHLVSLNSVSGLSFTLHHLLFTNFLLMTYHIPTSRTPTSRHPTRDWRMHRGTSAAPGPREHARVIDNHRLEKALAPPKVRACATYAAPCRCTHTLQRKIAGERYRAATS